MEVHINYAAVLAATAAYFLLGWAWHSPLLFGNTWMKLMGIKMPPKMTEEAKKTMMRGMVGGFFVSFVTAMCLAHNVQSGMSFYHVAGVQAGFQAGFWTWLGFVATIQFNTVLWENRPIKLYLLNTSYQLISFIMMATILAVWQ